MKVIVAGVGRLGSTVAFTVGILNRPEKIMLYDIKDLEGDILDLDNALGRTVMITDKLEPTDILIITAGQSRDKENFKTMDSILEVNRATVSSVVAKMEPYITSDTIVIVMTNPVESMAEHVSNLLSEKNITVLSPEKQLMELRKNSEVGWKIISTKGYTNFGPAMSCAMLIEELANE
jgi:malate/lactate dehydrogenase